MSPTSPAPNTNRTLTRHRSSPSLSTVVGLPPPIPESPRLPSPVRSIRHSRSQLRIHRGDVSSSATSSCGGDSDDETNTEPFQRSTAVKLATLPPPRGQATPKRKVVQAINTMSVGRPQAGTKRVTLQDRLNAVAKVRPSKSMEGLDLSVPPVPPLPASSSKLRMSSSAGSSARPASPEKAKSGSKNDKVIVCVRSVWF
jgi:hypothetical protein